MALSTPLKGRTGARHLTRLLRFALLAALLAGPARAQDSTLTRLIRQHQLPLTPAGPRFACAGWDKLQQSIQKSQFLLIGEAHSTA